MRLSAAGVDPFKEPVVLRLERCLSVASLQDVIRTLCQAMGLDRETTFRWMVGFSDLALSLFPYSSAGGRILLRLLRRSGNVGLEMTFVNAHRTALARGDLGWWIDECEVTRAVAGKARLVARKWAQAPEVLMH